ncbi:outer membrane protein [Bartonella phoceensis]|uniref:outer membrane protein n=1 Tax=Bartonella phoceensis TaxID=270249 RepID=UPI001ABA4E19|nr:outer membrane protein [Bartonella phoceensis]
MNTKRLITASVFALISSSAVQAADVMVPYQPTPVSSPAPTSVLVAPAFTWAGIYMGGQVSGFSSKADIDIVGKDKGVSLVKDLSPRLSGFEGGGLYAGSNIDLGDNFIFGIDTDLMWSGQKQTKSIIGNMPDHAAVDSVVARSGGSVKPSSEKPVAGNAAGGVNVDRGHHSAAHSPVVGYPHGANLYGAGFNPYNAQMMGGHGARAVGNNNANLYGLEQIKRDLAEISREQGEVDTLSHTLKQDWTGAARVRVGFSADRFMPYVAGGIAYARLRDTISVSFKKHSEEVSKSNNLTDETKTMIGYTLGGGIDVSVLDSIILRAEYRYSDFGKKKFAKEKLELNYKTNDFRVGVAYKF